MKKLLLLGSAALLIAGSVKAETKVVQFITGDLWTKTTGVNTQGMSLNGRYICGMTVETWEGFIYDIETGNLVMTSSTQGSKKDDTGSNQFWAVSNEGVAYGWDGNGGITLNMEGQYEVFEYLNNNLGVQPWACSADGSIVVGSLSSPAYTEIPCYWENGERHDLFFPTSKEAGFKINRGARATGVSADGTIIIGALLNKTRDTFTHLGPFVYWKRQDDGSYKYFAAYDKYYQDTYDVNGNLRPNYEGLRDIVFSPSCISPDGKTVVLRTQGLSWDDETKTGSINQYYQVALYDMETDEVTYIPYSRTNKLYTDEFDFQMLKMSNNGYIIGVAGSPMTGGFPVILFPGEYDNAKTLTEAFPGNELLEKYATVAQGNPYVLTGMSEDASYMSGYVNVFMDIPGYETYPSYAGFYIVTGLNDDPDQPVDPKPDPDDPSDSGVGSIDAENGANIYYNVNGLRSNTPFKGLNIVRTSNGKTSKIFVKE